MNVLIQKESSSSISSSIKWNENLYKKKHEIKATIVIEVRTSTGPLSLQGTNWISGRYL